MRSIASSVRLAWLSVAGVLAVSLVLGLGSTSEAKPRPQPPRTFELTYAWSLTNVNDIGPGWPTATLILNGNGTLDAYDPEGGDYYPNAGTYVEGRRGRTIEFHLYNDTVYSGVLQTDGSYDGTMISGAPSTLGLTGVWTGHFVP